VIKTLIFKSISSTPNYTLIEKSKILDMRSNLANTLARKPMLINQRITLICFIWGLQEATNFIALPQSSRPRPWFSSCLFLVFWRSLPSFCYLWWAAHKLSQVVGLDQLLNLFLQCHTLLRAVAIILMKLIVFACVHILRGGRLSQGRQEVSV